MVEKKIAVIGIEGGWSTEALADAVKAKTGLRLVVDMSKVSLDLVTGDLIYGDVNLSTFDGLMVKKISARYSPDTLNRLALLKIPQSLGVRVFSAVDSMFPLINRLSCTLRLIQGGIPMPQTLVTENIDEAVAAVHKYSSAVFKPLFSTKAQGMCVIDAQDNPADIRQKVTCFKADNSMMYIQQKVNLPGQDLGLVFLGGEYLGSYARVNHSDTWNTTIQNGGRYASYTPSAKVIELAYRAQKLFNLDFTTVDVAETDNGSVIFEVSAFGGFRGALEGMALDAASHYVDYALNQLS